MATLVLSAAGSAIGGAIGGSFLGISAAAIGQAIGASVGGAIDQSLFGPGDQFYQTGRIESFRLQNSVEGAPIRRISGRNRVAGQLIWSSPFIEDISATSTGGGGKFNSQPTVTTERFTYSINVAFALCEGEINKLGRVWADGEQIRTSDLNMTVYSGSQTQSPDPVISRFEGVDATPAFRGISYVVLEGLDLTAFGNRVPQFNFEVFRKPMIAGDNEVEVNTLVEAVALMPGSGEYVLATEPVSYAGQFAQNYTANVHTGRGQTDFVHAMEDLQADLPNCSSVSLVTSWFGDDLRCGQCTLRPKVEHQNLDGGEMPWQVSGVGRYDADVVSQLDNAPVFGGTPTDASVTQAIQHIKSNGQSVVFYPFIMMDIQSGNSLLDPYGNSNEQPNIPWRGRITASIAPNRAGSPDKTIAMRAEIDTFFGSANASDFTVTSGGILYSGPDEWSYRRFVLHYAHLCAAAGGVDAFCIGSEMRGLTQLRAEANSFPAVEKFIELADDVRAILGSETKIGYAADWSEYFGYHPQDGSNDLFFHLDGLWSHSEIDFVGIDNYMPLSDWRDEKGHADEQFGQIYEQDYLKANIEGGEGFDWFYATKHARDIQSRSPITDGAYGEPWVYRYKDIRSWWSLPHYNRISGVREDNPTSWTPTSKPIWFTEYGFPAIDKGSNQPNVFLDAKSSESAVPYYSNSSHDPQLQASAIQAVLEYWSDAQNNPISGIYGGEMVDLSKAHLWAWDARPWPDFPERLNVWSDGGNHELGHWVSGRTGSASLDKIVAEICEYSGLFDYDVTALKRIVVGFNVDKNETARQSLQSLMLVYDFTCYEIEGVLVFVPVSDAILHELSSDDFVQLGDDETFSIARLPKSEQANRMSIGFWNPDKEYQYSQSDARKQNITYPTITKLDVPVVLRSNEASHVIDRLLQSENAQQETISFALPLSRTDISVGDVFKFKDQIGAGTFRVISIEEHGYRIVQAKRVYLVNSDLPNQQNSVVDPPDFVAPNPVFARFLDLPKLKADASDIGPYLGITAEPWQESAAVYCSPSDENFELAYVANERSIFGSTLNSLPKTRAHVWSNVSVDVSLSAGALYSLSDLDVLEGGNFLAIRLPDEDEWEVLQFQSAVLNPDGTYTLSRLLRGQLGTDGIMPDIFPIGSEIAILDGSIGQIELTGSDLLRDKNYRYGAANRIYSDETYQMTTIAAKGTALRPYSVVHPRVSISEDSTLSLDWIRRTRAFGDYWATADVPLEEAREQYLVSILKDNVQLRQETVFQPSFVYSAANQIVDGAVGEIEFEISQVSEIFGQGPKIRISIDV